MEAKLRRHGAHVYDSCENASYIYLVRTGPVKGLGLPVTSVEYTQSASLAPLERG